MVNKASRAKIREPNNFKDFGVIQILRCDFKDSVLDTVFRLNQTEHIRQSGQLFDTKHIILQDTDGINIIAGNFRHQ